MNLQNITTEEILALSKKTEGQQIVFLNSSGILQLGSCSHIESLPDLADRLWREVGVSDSMFDLYQIMFECDFDWDSGYYVDFYRWWALDALPIHRIQAALLALKRAGEVGR